MAIVRHLEQADGANVKPQGDVRAQVRLVETGGEKFVQIDTYGSATRQEVDKVSQSLRLSKAAFDQLVQLGSKHF